MRCQPHGVGSEVDTLDWDLVIIPTFGRHQAMNTYAWILSHHTYEVLLGWGYWLKVSW